MSVAHIGRKLREKIHDFSGILSKDFCKVLKRFIEEMIYGIQTRGSVRLSEVARSLNEDIPLKETMERFSRHLARKELGPNLVNRIIKEGASRVNKDSLLVVDISDITKRYAEKMEYLADVRDGSENRLSKGYWTISVISAECGEQEITPLYQTLYSQEAPGFLSENAEIEKAIESVSEYTNKKGIWVIDRGGDRRKIIYPFLDKERRFLIRMKGNRHVIFRGKARAVTDVAASCPLPYADVIMTEKKDKEVKYRLEYGFRKVRLPDRKEQLYMLVVKGFGQKPLMVLTNIPLRKKRTMLWWAVEAYLTRWRIEDTIRFIKQSYNIEDIRVLTYTRLRNMMSLVLAAAYFAAVYLGTHSKLQILAHHVLKAAKRIFGIPDFRYYALADGIKEILNRTNKGTFPRKRDPTNNDMIQLCLDF